MHLSLSYVISADRRTLTILADGDAQTELLALQCEDPDAFGSNVQMWDAFEQLICNSELQWIDPAICGDMTDAPILGIWGDKVECPNAGDTGSGHILVGRWDRKTWGAPVVERWGFMSYALRSPLEDLLHKGEAIFTAP